MYKTDRGSKCVTIFVYFALIFFFTLTASAAAAEKIKFGVPSWPGVTVKTEVVSQILTRLGYETEQLTVSPTFIFKSLETGDLNVFLGGWTPVENPMIDPLVEKGIIEKVQANIEDAVVGLCVPDYVWDAGIRTIADVTKHPEEFNKKIFGIETGSGINNYIEDAINADAEGLGSWNMISSTTSAMLSQAGDFMKNKKWITFVGWAPHWMNVKYNFKYLESTPSTRDIASKTSIVYTIVPTGFSTEHPNVYKFLKQFQVALDVQSEWIMDFNYKNKRPEDVAAAWIKNNKETVAKWLENVTTIDGKPAIAAVY